jgi:hypothetical protein
MNDITVQIKTDTFLKIATSASVTFKIAAVTFTTSQVLAFSIAFFVWRTHI